MKKQSGILIFGCGGHGLSVADVILFKNPQTLIIFIDENAKANERIMGFDVLKDVPPGEYKCFVAIGDNLRRKSQFEKIDESRIISVISPTAYFGYETSVGRGCFVGNYCHLGPHTIVGSNTILNTSSVIEHEVKIGRHCHIGPGATICGRTVIGDLVFIGAGATVADKIRICSNVIVGAGSVVTEDIIEPGTYVGAPARRIK